MKILFVTPRFPYPPTKGDKLRSYFFIRELARHHEVSLLSFADGDDEQYRREMEKWCRRVELVPLPLWKSIVNAGRAFFSPTPLQVAYYTTPAMSEALTRLLREEHFDLVHVSLLRMGEYARSVAGCPVVIDHIDNLIFNMERRADKERFWLKKALFRHEANRLRAYEAEFSNIPSLITSEVDRRSYPEGYRMKVVANGIDLDKFACDAEQTQDKDIDMLFVGNMGYFPNVEAARYLVQEVKPVLEKSYGPVNAYIVGANPNRAVRELEKETGVVVTGFVDDVRDYLKRAKVFVAPLLAGTGIQNKILEAMSAGVPVVTTSFGNAGIQAVGGEEMLLADEPVELASAVASLLRNPERRQQLLTSARNRVERTYSWASKGDELEAYYLQVLSAPGAVATDNIGKVVTA